MFERVAVCMLTAMTLAIASPLAAQDDEGFAERERALARELAEQQRERDAQQAERQAIQQQQRELAREYEARQRELVAQQAEQQRSIASDFEAQQREFAAQQEETQELARELSRAKAELNVSAVEIARLSAQLSGNAMGDATRSALNGQRVLLLGQGSVLGINVQDTNGGVRVNGVTPNGPAAAAGVAVGDTIVAIDGVELDDGAGTAAFLAQMEDIGPGDDVELRIRRGGNARVVVVTATENAWRRFQFEPFYRDGLVTLSAPAAPAAPAPGAAPAAPFVVGPGGFFGGFRWPWSDVELVSLTPALGEYFGTEEGLLVVRAGNMSELGLRDGDVILEIGGREPQSPEHATRILSSFEPGESLQASIMRQRRRETLAMTVPTSERGVQTIEPGSN